jgi:hypothetical protein
MKFEPAGLKMFKNKGWTEYHAVDEWMKSVFSLDETVFYRSPTGLFYNWNKTHEHFEYSPGTVPPEVVAAVKLWHGGCTEMPLWEFLQKTLGDDT